MPTASDAAPTGLREQKKLATRRAIHQASLEIVLEAGMEAVTVEEIARRSGISRRTFFNHFSSLDEALTSHDPDRHDRLVALLLARPAHESVLDSIEAVTSLWLARSHDPELKRLRKQAAHACPEFKALLMRDNSDLVTHLVDALEQVKPPTVDRLELAVTVAAAFGMVRACLAHHASSDAPLSLEEQIARGFAILRAL